MNTIRNLEEQLAAAKAKELAAHQTALLNQFKEFEGRTFLYQSPNLRGFVEYGHIRLVADAESPVEVTTRRVWAFAQAKAYPGSEVARRESLQRYRIRYDMVEWHKKEVNPSVFREAWALAGNVACATSQALTKLASADIPVWATTTTQATEGLDYPHVGLTPPEASLLSPTNIYPLGPDKLIYLLTPKSRALALAELDAQDGEDARCAHLYQAIDMNYVLGRRSLRATLRSKLTSP